MEFQYFQKVRENPELVMENGEKPGISTCCTWNNLESLEGKQRESHGKPGKSFKGLHATFKKKNVSPAAGMIFNF